MRRFGDRDMWAQRNQATGRAVPDAPTEVPASAITLTEESGARMSELTPLYTSNRGGLIMTTASDYGTLHAAGRPQ